jgi:hypothetical protein
MLVREFGLLAHELVPATVYIHYQKLDIAASLAMLGSALEFFGSNLNYSNYSNKLLHSPANAPLS